VVANASPVANPGFPQDVRLGVTVTLDGSTSTDPDGDALAYSWSLSLRPAGSSTSIGAAVSRQATFVADVEGVYEATLVVNDGKASSEPAISRIVVAAAGASPVARAQDGREFSAPVESSLAPLSPDFASSSRWVGMLDGAAYRVEVPANWNGSLLIWARGLAFGSSLFLENPYFRRHLLEAGYAWAASSYTKNLYDVRAAIEDSNRLANRFSEIARVNGRALAEPRRVFIAGWSMGGHVAAAAVESEVVRDSINRRRYDGALSLCGSVTDIGWYDYLAAYQLALQQVASLPAESYPSGVFFRNEATLRAFVLGVVNSGNLGDPRAQKLYNLTQNLSGGSRPFFREGFFDDGQQRLLLSLVNGPSDLYGVLAASGVDTRDVIYSLAGDASPDGDSQAFNASILRVTPAANANPLLPAGLRWVPMVKGQLTAPVMVLHTLGDLIVPVSSQGRYAQRVAGQGARARLTQRLIRDVGHCSFTQAEAVQAFKDLTAWVETGQQPAGDDLTQAATWQAAQAGCRFTDNALSSEDRADPVNRSQAQARYANCPAR
jgi:alpha-beta hydrolase superfamily lysophospholipase